MPLPLLVAHAPCSLADRVRVPDGAQFLPNPAACLRVALAVLGANQRAVLYTCVLLPPRVQS